jgi:transcriptional regulator with XRE-family HTH domain
MSDTEGTTKLGQAIRQRRTERKLTLEQLSALSGVSRAAISKIERGQSSATSPVLGKLAEALDLSISQLIGGPRIQAVLRIPRDRQPVSSEASSGFERRSLSPLYLGRGIDFVINHLPPKARTGPFPSHRLPLLPGEPQPSLREPGHLRLRILHCHWQHAVALTRI